MNNSRIVALVLGCLAALLVIMAGKSCAGDIRSQNRKASGGNGQAAVQTTAKAAPRLIDDTPSPAPQTSGNTEADTEPQYEEVTDAFGRVTATVPVTQPETEAAEEETEPTTLSPIDEIYEQQKQNATNELSGFNHGTPEQQHEKELENATFPSEFNITLN